MPTPDKRLWFSKSRRSFLITSVICAAGSTFSRAQAALIKPFISEKTPARNPLAQIKSNLDALPAFVDTLIPEHLGPSATQMKVHVHLINLGLHNTKYQQLLSAGCTWLEVIAKKNQFESFSVMPEQLRIKVVDAAEQADKETIARIFFERVRHDAFNHYYAQPETWAYLHYSGPPQPHGFIDYTKPLKSDA